MRDFAMFLGAIVVTVAILWLFGGPAHAETPRLPDGSRPCHASPDGAA